MSSELWMVLEITGTIAFIIGVFVLLVFASLRMARRQDAQQESRIPLTVHQQRLRMVERAQRELAEQFKLRQEQRLSRPERAVSAAAIR